MPSLLASTGLFQPLAKSFINAAEAIGGLFDGSTDPMGQVWNGDSFSPLRELLADAVRNNVWTVDQFHKFYTIVFQDNHAAWGSEGYDALQEGFAQDPLLMHMGQMGLGPKYFYAGPIEPGSLEAPAATSFKLFYEEEVTNNAAPTIIPDLSHNVQMDEGQTRTVDISKLFEDAEGDAFSVKLVERSQGVNYTFEDGQLVLSPKIDAEGEFTFVFRANDGLADSKDLSLTLNVQDRGPGVVEMSRTFVRTWAEHDSFQTALDKTISGRGIDLTHDGAIDVGSEYKIAKQFLTIRGVDGLQSTFHLAGDVRSLVLKGAADFDVNGNSLQNNISGNDGDNRINGAEANDKIVGGVGDDVISGGADRDLLQGDAGADILMGDSGDDRLRGGDGDDLLVGGMGRNQLWGGAGADTFAFQNGESRMTVWDFAKGQDTVAVSGFAGVTDFASMMSQAAILEYRGMVTRITLDGDQIFLYGVKATELSTDMFDFGGAPTL